VTATPKGFLSGTHRLISPEATVTRVQGLLPLMGITRVANVTGLGDWLRVTTGLLEVLGGLLLGARRTAGVGAVLLGVVMTGAAVAHLVVLGTAPTGPAVLLAGLAAVAYAHRAALRVVAAFLVRNL